MKLYGYWRSTTSYRVRAALNLKGLAYETVAVDLLAGDQHAEAYRACNPAGGVPALVLGDGTVLTQSLAILDFLEAICPEPRLVPADPVMRARVMAAAQVLAVDVHPVTNLRVVRSLRSELGIADERVRDWMLHWVREGCTVLERQLRPDTAFSFGGAPEIVDLCIVSQIYNARRWGMDLAPFPKIARVEAACLAVPEIAAAHPDRQPDARPDR